MSQNTVSQSNLETWYITGIKYKEVGLDHSICDPVIVERKFCSDFTSQIKTISVLLETFVGELEAYRIYIGRIIF